MGTWGFGASLSLDDINAAWRGFLAPDVDFPKSLNPYFPKREGLREGGEFIPVTGQAFYRLSSRILSRSKGNTLVGYAAYLAAENLQDERYGETRRCHKQRFQERLFAAEILAPEGAPAWVYHRQQLHNRIEAAERRRDSQLAREVIFSFPTQLDATARQEVLRRFVREQYVDKGMVADISYHNFVGEGSHNPHAHVLLTMRQLEGDGFAKAKEKQWQPAFSRSTHGAKAAGDMLAVERSQWELELNNALEDMGIGLRVDCRSLSERGIDRLPEPKKGRAAAMERRPEWEAKTRAMDAWREVHDINLLKEEERKTKAEIAEIEQLIAQLHLQELVAEQSRMAKKRQRTTGDQKPSDRGGQGDTAKSLKQAEREQREFLQKIIEENANKER